MIGFSSTIGVCNDLTLNAASTTMMGGREDDGEFRWLIYHESSGSDWVNSYCCGSYVELDRSSLDHGELYTISLTVTNWYNASSHEEFEVFVSDEAVPRIILRHVFSGKICGFEGVFSMNHLYYN